MRHYLCLEKMLSSFRSCDSAFLIATATTVLWRPLSWCGMNARRRITLIQCLSKNLGKGWTLNTVNSALTSLEQHCRVIWCSWRDKSPDGKQSYADYLASGFYLKTPDQPSYFIPRISPLQLLLYVHKHANPNTLVFSLCFVSYLLIFRSRMVSVPR
jgi:hypothetical protein